MKFPVISIRRKTWDDPSINIKSTNTISDQDLEDLQEVKLKSKVYCVIKRSIDIICSFLGLVVLVLPMLIIALIIYIDDPGNVLFCQWRVGRNGKKFRFYKFRSMKVRTPGYLSTSDVDDPGKYITKVGKFLRRSSLDEIPQLFNVLKGDMSLVGPRPLIPNEEDIHKYRTKFGVYAVRPGVTGLAQINGRDTVSPVDKVRWDVKYVEHFGFVMDFKILFSTIPKILGGDGIIEGYSIKK